MTAPGEADYLTLDDMLQIAHDVLPDVIVRDPGLIDAAVTEPMSLVFGTSAYPTLAEKAAALMHAVATQRALLDGNKRLAWVGARVFCLLNGQDLLFSADEAETLIRAVAAGKVDVPSLAEALHAHLQEASI